MQVILGKEEEQLRAALVEACAGDEQWTAEGNAGIPIPVSRLDHFVRIVEPFVSVQFFVPEIIIRAAMKLVRPALEHRAHQPSARVAKLGG